MSNSQYEFSAMRNICRELVAELNGQVLARAGSCLDDFMGAPPTVEYSKDRGCYVIRLLLPTFSMHGHDNYQIFELVQEHTEAGRAELKLYRSKREGGAFVAKINHLVEVFKIEI